MSAVDAFETALLDHLFQNAAIANVGDAAGLPISVGAGSVQLALATVAYNDADTLLTADEVVYTGYVRPTDTRNATEWPSSGTSPTIVQNGNLIQFGEMTAGGPDTVVHLGLGLIGTGDILRIHADLDADLVINNGVNPQFAVNAFDISLD